MKKFKFKFRYLSILLLILPFLIVHSCSKNIKYTSIEQSLKNFEEYTANITEVAETYGLVVEEEEYDEEEERKYETLDSISKDLFIILNGAERIEIIMQNDLHYYDSWNNKYVKPEEGLERFSVTYILWGEHAENCEYDTQLFADIVNVMSGREISATQVEKFLQSPKYEYVDNETTMYKIQKIHPLNFWEHWQFNYDLTLQGEGTLSFGGFTKQIGG